ncbi:unnamed protein product [Heterosigma akashiwo]|mmetsp:Transcript_8263/g.14196  ORF Transcript_8263/g.14196 Transcript_8263/m.14196 type:complete len:123 (-) Transcript_8263:268-636(-)|eukprot:CAMPEP_0194575612 /NCGR_PEP_ID=MMETSP0292-20121207/11037_1 /TAXON_ID=39354 /ORGANISM="Heterosigma akashiwo, Strain CCMP2393" /LENGTH=122 /DNA_ID=CAMNT_0039427455 /DNA_START=80 /DNA_END=448 /DNA_ORIENTATION=-
MSNRKQKLNIIENAGEENDSPENSGFKSILGSAFSKLSAGGKWCKDNVSWVAQKGGTATWIIATTAIVVALPLVFEIEREQQVIELEKIQVKHLREQGVPAHELAQMGFTSALDPAVVSHDS